MYNYVTFDDDVKLCHLNLLRLFSVLKVCSAQCGEGG